MRFTKVFRTELGHKYILVECSVVALCLPVMSKISRYNSCAINRTMIVMSIKRISVLNLCLVLKPFVKSTPEAQSLELTKMRCLIIALNRLKAVQNPSTMALAVGPERRKKAI